MFKPPMKLAMGKLLSESKLAIPIYQRGYAWEDEHIEAFIGDISDLWRSAASGHAYHFLGTMLCHSVMKEAYGQTLEIIDGQQRLTTTSLLILAIREAAKTLAQSGQAEKKTEAGLLKLVTKCQGLLVTGRDGHEVAKLTLNEQDSREWNDLILTGCGVKAPDLHNLGASVQRIMGAFERVQAELVWPLIDVKTASGVADSLERLEFCFEHTINGLIIILVEADSEKDMFELFMVINDRGKPLSALDLVRTATLSRLKGPKSKEEFEEAKAEFKPLLTVEDDTCRKALAGRPNNRKSRVALKSMRW